MWDHGMGFWGSPGAQGGVDRGLALPASLPCPFLVQILAAYRVFMERLLSLLGAEAVEQKAQGPLRQSAGVGHRADLAQAWEIALTVEVFLRAAQVANVASPVHWGLLLLCPLPSLASHPVGTCWN